MKIQTQPKSVIPAKAGISGGSCLYLVSPSPEIPASAGMTNMAECRL